MAFLSGIVGLLILWVVYRLFSGKWDLLDLAKGDDGLPSSSMFQFLEEGCPFRWTKTAEAIISSANNLTPH